MSEIKRSSAFFINGGAGRVLCSIPALEKFAVENSEDDFVVICEGFSEFYKGNPILHNRVYESTHKNLFVDKIKSRNSITPEPYRIWEYYNQKANLPQAFDININNKGVRDLPSSKIYFTYDEFSTGIQVVTEVKEKTKKSKVLVFQPFGRGLRSVNNTVMDSSGRSFSLDDAISLIKLLQKDYAIILMTDYSFDADKFGLKDPIAVPSGLSLRQWASIIKEADYFVGVDSVGQHIANSLDKKATVIISATYPQNVSYINNTKFNIIDVGEGRRIYDPIRICMDELSYFNNESLMQMNKDVLDTIYKSIRSHETSNIKGTK